MEQRGDIVNELVGQATTAQKRKRQRSRCGKGSTIDRAGSDVMTEIESFHISQIRVSKNRFAENCPTHVRPDEVRARQDRDLEVRLAEVRVGQVRQGGNPPLTATRR